MSELYSNILGLAIQKLKKETGKEVFDLNEVVKYVTEHPELKEEIEDVNEFKKFLQLRVIYSKLNEIKEILERM